MTEQDRLLDLKEVSNLIGLGKTKTYHLLWAGEFGTVVKMGDKMKKKTPVRVWLSAVQDFIKKHSIT